MYTIVNNKGVKRFWHVDLGWFFVYDVHGGEADGDLFSKTRF
jgi:hypothetical protein